MIKPYTTKLSASGCVLGTALWLEANHANGLPCRVVHPSNPEPPCQEAGWIEYVVSYRVAKSSRNGKYRGVRINGKVYTPGDQLQVVVGGSVKP